jgi:hypothetical protein
MSMPEGFAQAGRPVPSVLDRLIDWVRMEGAWWASSFVFHLFLMSALMIVGGRMMAESPDEPPTFEEADIPPDLGKPPDVDKFDIAGEVPLEPTELTTETLKLTQPPGTPEEKPVRYDDNPIFTDAGGGTPDAKDGPALGGLGGFDVMGMGPGLAMLGPGGVGGGEGTSENPGVGGGAEGLGGRGTGSRQAMVGGFGGTQRTERAVAAALAWLARHQRFTVPADPDHGRWGLDDFTARCPNTKCDGAGTTTKSHAAATALALLPFLGAGQTPDTKGSPYQKNVHAGLLWLVRHQGSNGDLATEHTGSPKMYVHGLAALALCEAYGMTRNKQLEKPAQMALQFIESAQSSNGGWRYVPGEAGDTSVTGWQVMALKSGQLSGLSVNYKTFDGARRFLKSVSTGTYGGRFQYTQGNGGIDPGASPTMTAVGLLNSQYLGTRRADALMLEGVTFLLANPPDSKQKNAYYWYYATQVMHNIPGPDWDAWNRRMRAVLIEMQVHEGCAAGSWDPSGDRWLGQAGRIGMTSLCCLTLEVYYRYLPLYKLDIDALPEETATTAAPAPAAPPSEKP